MALEIELRSLGHKEPGEPDTHWVAAEGTRFYTLAVLLERFWLAATPAGADGPAISVRFA